MSLYFQGDICLQRIDDSVANELPEAKPADGPVVLAEGEATGHHHAFYEGGVTLLRDEMLAFDIPWELYMGTSWSAGTWLNCATRSTRRSTCHAASTSSAANANIRRRRQSPVVWYSTDAEPPHSRAAP